MIDHENFLNLFSAAYVASKRTDNYFSEYYLLSIPANQKDAIYLQFDVENDGFLDYCIKQFSDNKIEALTKKSRMRA